MKSSLDSHDFEISRQRLGTKLHPEAWDGSWCVVTVRDNGIGMPPNLVERIFEPFVTTKETGHGLGLSTCRRVLMAHGGTIAAANRLEGGAAFAFRLRLATD